MIVLQGFQEVLLVLICQIDNEFVAVVMVEMIIFSFSNRFSDVLDDINALSFSFIKSDILPLFPCSRYVAALISDVSKKYPFD